MPDLAAWIVLSAATYRIARFLLLDSLIEGTRDQVYVKLTNVRNDGTVPTWRSKLVDLLMCSFCITVWVALGTTLFWSLLVAPDWSGWAFLLAWPAVAAGSLVFWTYIDRED